MSEKNYFIQTLIAIDQLLNVVLCNGWADETMSSVAWRMEQQGSWFGKIMRPLIDTLFFFQPHHCQRSFDSERLRLQSPPEER